MMNSNVRVLVISPASYRQFRRYYPADLPVEKLLYEQHRHRFEMFSDFLGWRSRHIFRDETRGIESDAYDRENTLYSIAVDSGLNFLGSVRTYSTLHPYMLQEDEFAGSCHPGIELPVHPDIFEGSRIVNANSKLYKGYRPIKDIKIGAELLLSHLEIGLALGIEKMIGTMPPVLLDKLYGKMGWDIERIGPPNLICDKDGHALDEGVPTQNYIYPIHREAESVIRARTGLHCPVNCYGVDSDVLPDLFSSMKENALNPFPHRFYPDGLPVADHRLFTTPNFNIG